jgi:hypothetical protein
MLTKSRFPEEALRFGFTPSSPLPPAWTRIRRGRGWYCRRAVLQTCIGLWAHSSRQSQASCSERTWTANPATALNRGEPGPTHQAVNEKRSLFLSHLYLAAVDNLVDGVLVRQPRRLQVCVHWF